MSYLYGFIIVNKFTPKNVTNIYIYINITIHLKYKVCMKIEHLFLIMPVLCAFSDRESSVTNRRDVSVYSRIHMVFGVKVRDPLKIVTILHTM